MGAAREAIQLLHDNAGQIRDVEKEVLGRWAF
jgi:hypothetical protein